MSYQPNDLETTTVEIEGVTFKIRELPSLIAFRLSTKLVPIVPALLEASKHNITPLVEVITPELLEELLRVFRPTSCAVIREGAKTREPELDQDAGFDSVFRRKTKLLYLWLWECLKWNFSDFLAGQIAAQSAAKNEASPTSAAVPG